MSIDLGMDIDLVQVQDQPMSAAFNMSGMLNALSTDIYDMTEMLDAINEFGMQILCLEQRDRETVQRIVTWIVNKDRHSFPKTRKRWKNLINTQFAFYFPNHMDRLLYNPRYIPKGSKCYVSHRYPLFIATDADQIIDKLIAIGAIYGNRKLRVQKHNCKLLLKKMMHK